MKSPSRARDLDIGRLVENLTRRTALHDFAVTQHKHLFAQFEALRKVVRDEQHGDTEVVALTSRKHCVEFGAELSVEAARGFVEQQQFRRADQRARDRAALLLPAGELMRPAAGDLGEVEALQHFR